MKINHIISTIKDQKELLNGSIEAENMLFDLFNDIEVVEYIVENRNMFIYLLGIECSKIESSNENIYVSNRNTDIDLINSSKQTNIYDTNKDTDINLINTSKQTNKINYILNKKENEKNTKHFRTKEHKSKFKKLHSIHLNTPRLLISVPPGTDTHELFLLCSGTSDCAYFPSSSNFNQTLFVADCLDAIENDEIRLKWAVENCKQTIAIIYYCTDIEWIAEYLKIDRVIELSDYLFDIDFIFLPNQNNKNKNIFNSKDNQDLKSISILQNNDTNNKEEIELPAEFEEIFNLIATNYFNEYPILIIYNNPLKLAHYLFTCLIDEIEPISLDYNIPKQLLNYLCFGIGLDEKYDCRYLILKTGSGIKNKYINIIYVDENLGCFYRLRGIKRAVVIKKEEEYKIKIISRMANRIETDIIWAIKNSVNIKDWFNNSFFRANTKFNLQDLIIKFIEFDFIEWLEGLELIDPKNISCKLMFNNKLDHYNDITLDIYKNKGKKLVKDAISCFKTTQRAEILLKYKLTLNKALEMIEISKNAIEQIILNITSDDQRLLHALRCICICENKGCASTVDLIYKLKLNRKDRKIVLNLKQSLNYVEIELNKSIEVDVFIVDLDANIIYYDTGKNNFNFKLKKGYFNCIVSEVNFLNVEEIVIYVV